MKTRLKINPSYSALGDWLSRLPDDFGRGAVIYRGRNELRRFTTPDGTDLVVKRFGSLPLFRRVIYSTVVRSKARRSFDFGNRYLELGFDTPTPVACIEIYRGGILVDAYFVSLYSPAEPLFGPLVNAERFDSALADDVAQLMVNLHSKGAIHGDPNLKNILYNRSDDANVTLSLIDTNRSSFRRHISKRAALKNLMRVSHRRDLMRQIAGRYATLRGLDPIKTVDKVFASLNRFERNRSFRHRLKHIFGIN
ncbi:MAG: lipopolysaccharide kinase InaA family protein [Muribaculaceae bacterium]|nr:lipopolysaccharide kinase InaA family protein [Muribaculaceae bacterium]